MKKLAVGKFVRQQDLRRRGFRIRQKNEHFTIWRLGDAITLFQYNNGIICWIFHKPVIKQVDYNKNKGKGAWTESMERWTRVQRISYE